MGCCEHMIHLLDCNESWLMKWYRNSLSTSWSTKCGFFSPQQVVLLLFFVGHGDSFSNKMFQNSDISIIIFIIIFTALQYFNINLKCLALRQVALCRILKETKNEVDVMLKRRQMLKSFSQITESQNLVLEVVGCGAK